MLNGFVRKLPYGSNCIAELFYFSGLNFVVKQSINSISDASFSKMIIDDYANIKDKIYKSNTVVPFTYDIFLSKDYYPRLVIVESFMGNSLREIINTKMNKANIRNLISKSIELIKGLPQGIALDTNPGNIAISSSGILSFIDFIPPDPWRYRGTIWEKHMVKTFPTVAESYDYPKKVDAYYTTDGRLQRFNTHVSKLLRINCSEV